MPLIVIAHAGCHECMGYVYLPAVGAIGIAAVLAGLLRVTVAPPGECLETSYCGHWP